jgi:hypothetical protein
MMFYVIWYIHILVNYWKGMLFKKKVISYCQEQTIFMGIQF